ncbi:DnaD domain-containing protein [Paenibacillus sp. YYML68]|uniref:DnaD domain-containing protein n=1 Tax=Paenibacillus sp. YYML68 TaxID=2909250 RepID=UPI00249163EB|nr:DnaD domain protein [Paenibacillus sp. YYML68]
MEDIASVLLEGLQSGQASVPYWLLQNYTRLNLSEQEVMLVIQLMAFKQRENVDFPTPEQLQARMTLTQEQVLSVLQKLLKAGLLRIDERKDPVTGVHSELYNWTPLLERLAMLHAEERAAQQSARRLSEATSRSGKDVFSIFEREFGRPLTPMELETISSWLDKDKHPEALILAGLKEAVFAGRLHFRYIDRILLEWQRNRISTVEQAKEHSQKFRAR